MASPLGCRRRSRGRVWAGLRSKIETRRTGEGSGVCVPICGSDRRRLQGADGCDSEPNTSRAPTVICGTGHWIADLSCLRLRSQMSYNTVILVMLRHYTLRPKIFAPIFTEHVWPFVLLKKFVQM
jgi:hypothetical protein